MSLRIVFALGRDVAYCPPTDDDNGNANARLIAAAPTMLEALEAVRSQGLHGELEGGISVSHLVETAIAKAKGDSP